MQMALIRMQTHRPSQLKMNQQARYTANDYRHFDRPNRWLHNTKAINVTHLCVAAARARFW